MTKGRVVSGEVNETSRAVGALEGTVKILVDQQSALFRKLEEQNGKLDTLNQSFTGYSQQTLASVAGADRRIYDLEEKHGPLDERVDGLEDFRTTHEAEQAQKARNRMTLFAVGGFSGGFISQAIEFFKGIGHS